MKHHFPLLALLSFIFTGCPKYTADCPVYEDLNQDQDVTIYDLKQLTEDWATEAIACESLCASIEYQISGFDTEIDDCSLELDIQAYQDDPASAEDSTVVGNIQCTGLSVALCE